MTISAGERLMYAGPLRARRRLNPLDGASRSRTTACETDDWAGVSGGGPDGGGGSLTNIIMPDRQATYHPAPADAAERRLQSAGPPAAGRDDRRARGRDRRGHRRARARVPARGG